MIKVDRANLACDECRKKKIKCDSKRPICLNCEKKGLTCGFTPRSKTRKRARLDDLFHLREENLRLKAQLASLSLNRPSTSGVSEHDSSSSTPDNNSLYEETSNFNNNNNKHTSLSEITPVEKAESPPEFDRDYFSLDSPIDTLQNTIPNTGIENVTDVHRKAYDAIKNFQTDPSFQSYFSRLSLLEFHTMLESYWRYENVNIMIIWKRIFLSDILSNGGSGKYSSKSLILSVLAAGSTFCREQSLMDKGKECCIGAKEFLKAELWDYKITTPQTLCLLSIFQHSNGNRQEEIYYSKLAINVALKLGLNRDNEGDDEVFSKDEETVRRFTWWSCYQVDMFVRVAFKQAPSIRKELIGVSPPQVSPFRYLMDIPDSYFEFFFISTITLEIFVIAGEVLELCYGRWPTISSEETQGTIDNCIEELPQFWKRSQDNLGKPFEEFDSPQVLIFRVRFCYTHITIAGYFIEPQMLDPTPEEFEKIDICVKYTKLLAEGMQKYINLYGVWTLEAFTTDFLTAGLKVMLCVLNYGDRSKKREYLDYANTFIKFMLSFPNRHLYAANLESIKIMLTDWSVDLTLDDDELNDELA